MTAEKLCTNVSRLSGPALDPTEATDYEIAVSIPDGEMRILLQNVGGVLAFHVMPSHEAYALAQRILRGYDQLEGLL